MYYASQDIQALTLTNITVSDGAGDSAAPPRKVTNGKRKASPPTGKLPLYKKPNIMSQRLPGAVHALACYR